MEKKGFKKPIDTFDFCPRVLQLSELLRCREGLLGKPIAVQRPKKSARHYAKVLTNFNR